MEDWKARLDPRTVTAALKRGGFKKGGTTKTRVGQLPVYGFDVHAEKEYIHREGNPGLGIIGDRKTGAVVVEHGHGYHESARNTPEHAAMMTDKYREHLESQGFDVEQQGRATLRVKKRIDNQFHDRRPQ